MRTAGAQASSWSYDYLFIILLTAIIILKYFSEVKTKVVVVALLTLQKKKNFAKKNFACDANYTPYYLPSNTFCRETVPD